MFPYILNIVLLLSLSLVLENYNQRKVLGTTGVLKYNKTVFLFSILVIWTILYALKGTTGTDAGGYWRAYKKIYYSRISFIRYITPERDKLFHGLNWWLSNVFAGYWIPACAVFAVLLYAPVLYVINKESESPGFSCFIYVTSMSMYFGYNGLRQGIAMSISMFAFFVFLKNKKYILYAILLVIAFGFHAATLMVVPLHIILLQKVNSFKGAFIILLMIIGYFFLVNMWASFVGLFEVLGQDKFVQDYGTIKEATVNRGSFLRILVPLALLIFSVMNYRKMKSRHPEFDMDMWVIIIAFLTTILIRKFVYFARVGAFVSCMVCLTVPKLSSVFPDRKKKVFFILFVGGLYFLYMVLLLLHGESNLYPYVPVWENGRF